MLEEVIMNPDIQGRCKKKIMTHDVCNTGVDLFSFPLDIVHWHHQLWYVPCSTSWTGTFFSWRWLACMKRCISTKCCGKKKKKHGTMPIQRQSKVQMKSTITLSSIAIRKWQLILLELLLLVLLSFLRHPVVVAVLSGIHVYVQPVFHKTAVTHLAVPVLAPFS